MLFIPGGSNDFGEAEPYNASVMASNHAALICSINYRVGPFGFLSFAEDAAAGHETGNHALTDIQAALRFLRREAKAFVLVGQVVNLSYERSQRLLDGPARHELLAGVDAKVKEATTIGLTRP